MDAALGTKAGAGTHCSGSEFVGLQRWIVRAKATPQHARRRKNCRQGEQLFEGGDRPAQSQVLIDAHAHQTLRCHHLCVATQRCEVAYARPGGWSLVLCDRPTRCEVVRAAASYRKCWRGMMMSSRIVFRSHQYLATTCMPSSSLPFAAELQNTTAPDACNKHSGRLVLFPD